MNSSKKGPQHQQNKCNLRRDIEGNLTKERRRKKMRERMRRDILLKKKEKPFSKSSPKSIR